MVLQRGSRRTHKGRLAQKVDSAKKAKSSGDPTKIRVRSGSNRRKPARSDEAANRPKSPFYDVDFVREHDRRQKVEGQAKEDDR